MSRPMFRLSVLAAAAVSRSPPAAPIVTGPTSLRRALPTTGATSTASTGAEASIRRPRPATNRKSAVAATVDAQLRRRRAGVPSRPLRGGRRACSRRTPRATPTTPGASTCSACRPGRPETTPAPSRRSTRRFETRSHPSEEPAQLGPRAARDRPAAGRARAGRAGAGDRAAVGRGLRLKGRAHHELGQIPEAIDAYQRAIALDDRDVWAMNNLGYLYIQQGRSDAALPPLARAVELRGNVPVFQNNFGTALERSGHFVDRAEAYQAALAGGQHL